MIFSMRTARIAPGKAVDAIAFAKDICTYAKEKIGLEVKVFTQVGGTLGNICWTWENKNLASFEEDLAKLTADPGWQKILQRGPGLFADGTSQDQIWRSI
jgi:hypothetical protein